MFIVFYYSKNETSKNEIDNHPLARLAREHRVHREKFLVQKKVPFFCMQFKCTGGALKWIFFSVNSVFSSEQRERVVQYYEKGGPEGPPLKSTRH
mgnify:CR=1 FL=1